MLKITLNLTTNNFVLQFTEHHSVEIPPTDKGLKQLHVILFQRAMNERSGVKTKFSTVGMPTQAQVDKMVKEFNAVRHERLTSELDDLGLSVEDLAL